MALSSKLGHFNVLEEIAHGGMGTVYRAFDPTLNREVAIKVLRENLAQDPKFLNDFRQEARSAAAISHPHVVQVYFVGEETDQYYIVMELLHGRTLREIIEEDGPMGEERALQLTIDVVEGLRAAYNKNQMIHGDIKPANIFITQDVGAKVLDFGLSKLANVEVAPGEGIWGSPYYISPERVGQKAEDFRSDVYSLGATLFQTLTGHPPFEADTPEELAGKRLNEKPPLLRDLNPDITRKTEEVVNKMLNKSIMLRYLDYDALLEDLQDAKTEATAKRLGVDLHPQLQPPPPEPEPPPTRSILPLVIAAVAVVLVIVSVLALVLRPHNKQPVKPAPVPVPIHITPTPIPAPRLPPPPPPPPPTVGLYSAEFTLKAPTAGIVGLAGDFNNWSPTVSPLRKRSNGEWAITVQLKPGRHEYKFIVDGKWMPDPENPTQVVDSYGGTNSVVVIAQFTPTPTPTPPPPPPPPPPTPPPPSPPPSAPSAHLYSAEFTLKALNARIVGLAGDFNNWSPTASPLRKRFNGEWAITVQLKPGRHEYKFIVDGKWMPDPENPTQVVDPYGGTNSVVVIGQ